MDESRASRTGPRPNELLSVAERMDYLGILRGGFVVVAVVVGLLGTGVRTVPAWALLGSSGLYALLLLVPGGARRIPRLDVRPILGAMLILDGVYLGWLAYATGGLGSPLRFLIYVHVIAVTMLGSYRTGLKIAAWHSIVLFVSAYAQSAGILAHREAFPSGLPGDPNFALASGLSVGALWAVALATAWFSAANERELRGQKIDLEELSEMVAEIDARNTPADIPRILLDRVCSVFGFTRGLVLASPKDDLSLVAYRGSGEPAGMDAGLDHVIERAWDARQTLLVHAVDPERDPRLDALLPGARNLLIVPLFLAGGYRLGIMAVEHGGTRAHVKRWIVTMVEQFASHAALALHNAWLVDELERQLEENKALEAQLLVQNMDLEAKVQERTQELSESLENLRIADAGRRALLARLVTAEEAERQRIAGDVHDGPIQLLTAAGLGLEMVRKSLAKLGQRDMNERIEEALAALTRAVEGMRTLTFDLRPSSLDEQGLASALREYLQYRDPDLRFVVEDRIHGQPPEAIRLILFCVAQEALANVRKHAKATRVDVLISERDGGYVIRVRDNGVGFDSSEIRRSREGHLGLSSMRERAQMAGGTCEVHSRPGGGTSMECWLPAEAQGAPRLITGSDPRLAERGAA